MLKTNKIFHNHSIKSSHYSPVVDSFSNRNGYQEYFLGSKGGRFVGLTSLPPSCGDCLETWEPQPPGNVRAYTGVAFPLPFTV